MWKLLVAIGVITLLANCGAIAQVNQPSNRTTTHSSAVVAAGNTFQTLLSTGGRSALTIQNNNTTTDNCWIYLGGGTATKADSILLQPGGSYSRYWPFVPSDTIQGTCASTSNTIYLDYMVQ